MIMEEERYKEFFEEMKRRVRCAGRSNMITIQEIEGLINKYSKEEDEK